MDTQRLELLLELVKTGNFSLTAKRYFRTQPAVSIAVRKMEEELGVRLVERGGRRVKLTPEGDLLKKQMADILRLVGDLKFQASVLGRRPKGRVKIATIHSVGLYELGDTIKLFIKKYRDIRLDLRYEQSREIYDLVHEKEVDFGIVAYPVQTAAIEVLPMPPDEMVLISSHGPRFEHRAQIALEELDGADFAAFPENIPTRRAIDGILEKAGVRVEIRFENENIETLKKAVEVGLGVSIVPRKAIEKDREGRLFSVMKIKGQPLRRPIGIVKSRKTPLSKAADLFVKELRRVS
ncbi:MAG: LysR family transcriptional regulator [Candidatus Omnitrophica bacterium]|nr:LysR family transcriptional regulator [Candidatus Omnitrophota bacterium]